MDSNLRAVLDWWMSEHDGTFSCRQLPITRQEDQHSCGILSWNALTAFFVKDVELIKIDDVMDARLEIFLRLTTQCNNPVRPCVFKVRKSLTSS